MLIIHPTKKIKSIPKFPPSVTSLIRIDGTLEISYDRSLIATEKLFDLCRQSGISIKDIETSEPALEDVFRLATEA